MTFTEAAIEVLRREGKPLHFRKLAEIAIRENLLDHVGKIPEETMADQLAAHCRLPHSDRRVIPVQAGTFALSEWGLEEDASGLDALVEPPPEGELAYRGRERHPVPSRDLTRTAGRGEGGRGEGGRPRRRDEEERRARRFPPPAEVAYEILAGAGKPLTVLEIASTGAERLLMPDAFVRDAGALRAALAEDNHRREGAGRKPLFQLEGDEVTLVAQPEPGERVAVPVVPRGAPTAQEIRRAALAALRHRLRECDGATVEHVAGRLLEKLGFKDLKVAKRGREHVVCTAKRRMGLADVRHAVRIVRSGADATRRDVVDVRRDLGHYGAQIGIVISAGDAAREARAEAAAAGQLPIMLLCGEALAEAFAEAGVGCVPVVVPEVDDAFFKAAAETAEREEAARRSRRDERERREGRHEEGPRPPAEPGGETAGETAISLEAPVAPASLQLVAAGDAEEPGDTEDAGEDEDEGDAEEGEEGGAAEGAAPPASAGEPGTTQGAERRRRRRRRRRRGGRGRGAREGGAPGAEGGGGEGASTAAPAPPSGSAPVEISVGPAQPREPSNGGGEG
jgi:hypothetical protein